MSLKEGWRGRFFEDFEVGDVYRHPLGRTMTETDNVWFTLLTQNTAPIHFDRAENRGAEANMAKLLAADASWEAANVAVQTFGGYGVDAEYDVEPKFRETRLYQVALISTNLILFYLAQHVLGLPRSF